MIPVANAQGIPGGLKANGAMVLNFSPASNYRAQFAFSFVTDMLAIRRKYGSLDWTEWKYFKAGNASSSLSSATYVQNDYYENFKEDNLPVLAYQIVNGICFVRARIRCITPTSSWRTIATGMPGSIDETVSTCFYVGYLGATGEKIALRIQENGVVTACFGVANQLYQASFCYPCQ